DVDLHGLVTDVVSATEPLAHTRGLRIEVAEDDVPGRLHTDPIRLKQILLNLVSNACKFTDSGGVTLAVRGEGARVRFVVSDTGIGIAPEDLERVLRPFEQADNSSTRRHGGTGLGLAISVRPVELLGGALEVQSTPGEGSTFAFWLPAAA
ncbi:MAG: ATP-binding protein, partial [Myxococcales bacterium]|nr:ATP-binding protein [Myxococcales bacterium]